MASPDTAVVFQSPKYIQQRGALKHIGDFVRVSFPNVKQAAIITSARLRAKYIEQLNQSIPNPVVAEFSGECSRSNLDKLLLDLSGQGVDYIIGFGGGKLLDMAKLVADKLGLPQVMVPSLASTDAPCIAMGVVYTDAGEFDEYKFIPRSPDLVIVDSQVIADAPVEYLVAGMGDAMATYYEARAVERNPAATTWIHPLTYRPPRIARAIAGECANILFAEGVQAKQDCVQHTVTEALEHVIEANILLSGLGVECGGLAVAHGLHNAFTLLPETHSLMHGQKVAFGTMVHLLVEDNKEEALRVAQFNKAVGLPTTLRDLHVDLTDEKLQLLVGNCLEQGNTCWNVGPRLTADTLRAAITEADKLGGSI